MHYMKTKKGRKEASARMKKAWAEGKYDNTKRNGKKKPDYDPKALRINKPKEHKNGSRPGIKKENEVVAYLFGQTEKAISDRARSAGVSYPILARRVGQLLQQTAGREVHGAGN